MRRGQSARGVFILCNGQIKLFGTSSSGKALIFRIAEPGEIIGLPSTLSGKQYELTAEALEPIQANFIRRDDFLSFLRGSSSAAEKLARFLLDLKPAKTPNRTRHASY